MGSEAFKFFEGVTATSEKGDLNELEEQGLIKSFEYTYELAWNVLKDFYEDQGETGIQGSKDAIRIAFSRGLIANAEIWMEMVESRKLTVHTYDEKTASAVISIIKTKYLNSFLELHADLEKIRLGNQTSLLL
jgi:nucleotidyltransferase substrate binding protein (TIGR01987 family)